MQATRRSVEANAACIYLRSLNTRVTGVKGKVLWDACTVTELCSLPLLLVVATVDISCGQQQRTKAQR